MYNDLLIRQRNYLSDHYIHNYHNRKRLLLDLKEEIINNTSLIEEALFKDLSKSSTESYLTEISIVINELNYLIKNLKKLMKPIKVKSSLSVFPSKSYLVAEPLGVVLVISPWNYPFSLALNPLIGAIASGNFVVLKPSEYSTNTNLVIINILNKVFKNKEVIVIEGAVKETTKLLEHKFDHIFFTGSTSVGKIIYKAASNNLTPVTLELGGKSPLVVTKGVNLEKAVKKIVFGKLINSGQTCIAPDYLFIDELIKDDFIKWFKYYVEEFYTKDILINLDYPKIINSNHHNRLINLLVNEDVIYGGSSNNQKLEPTLVNVTNLDSKLMTEEIFGPILPIITYSNINEVFNYLKSKEKPLSSYVFTNSKELKKRFINETSSGSLVFNDTIIQFANNNLPFGGVGASGIGKYHGEHSFKVFTHYKSVLDKKGWLDFNMRYHPYDNVENKRVRKLL